MLPSSRFRKFLLFCGAYAGASLPSLAAPLQQPGPPAKLSTDLVQIVNPSSTNRNSGYSRWSGSSSSSGTTSSTTDATTSVIIQYVAAPSASDLSTLSSLGATKPVVFKTIHAVQTTLPTSAINTLSSLSNIRYITPDRALITHAVVAGPGATAPAPAAPKTLATAGGSSTSIATSPEFTTDPINAPAAWNQGLYGAGIGVAVIDSGIAPERDLQAAVTAISPTGTMTVVGLSPQSRIVYNACFTTNCGADTYDHFGHGTHVAGLIGGNGAASYGPQYKRTFTGVAPGVNFINLKALDSNGQGTDAAVIQAIEAAIALKNIYNIRVINLSLGRPIYESYTLDPLCLAVEQAWKAGIVVVAAAGNSGRNLSLNDEGYGTVEAPGNDPYVLTVGAVRTNGTATLVDDAMASYSSKGPTFVDQVSKPDIVAPGNLVTSLNAGGNTLQQQNPTFYTPLNFYQPGLSANASNDYMPLSGTSMATGVTSGAVALLLNANPALTPDQVKALLMIDANKSVLPQTSSVTDSGVTYVANDDVFTVGAGYLDIGAAVRDAKSTTIPTGTAMSPLAEYDPNTGSVGLVLDQTALWGRTSVFTASGVYGTNAFVGGSTALWGRDATQASTALWGRSDPQAYTALWGSTALWGRGTTDAATALWGRSTLDSSTALWGR